MKNVFVVIALIVLSLVAAEIAIEVGTIEALMSAFLVTCGSYVIGVNVIDYE